MGWFKYWGYGLLGVVVAALVAVGTPGLSSWASVPGETGPGEIVQGLSPLEQALDAYHQGQYQRAVTLLEQATPLAAGPSRAMVLGNLSLAHQQLGQWDAAEAALNQAQGVAAAGIAPPLQAQLLDVQGQLQFARGQLDAALASWQASADLYRQLHLPDRLALSRLHQSQALQAKGLFHQVFRTLGELAADVAVQPDSSTKATILRKLGDSLRSTGNLDEAEDYLQQSLRVAEQLQAPELAAASHLSLGNLQQGRFDRALEGANLRAASGYAQQALAHYQQVPELDDILGIQAQLNLMRLVTKPVLNQLEFAEGFYQTLRPQLAQLPPSRSTVLAYTGLAENLITLRTQGQRSQPSWGDIAQLLASAQELAVALGDPRSQSIVLGTLAKVYGQNQRWSEAKPLARQALTLAQQANADDIRYRWEWQLGRILKAEGNTEAAIAAYTRAFKTLGGIRRDLLTANPDVQFSFRERVDPVYRELVALLVEDVPQVGDRPQPPAQRLSAAQGQAQLRQARDVMEALQVAELENFFQAACIDKTISIDQVVNQEDPTAAVIYAMVLEDRLEVVLKLPRQAELLHYAAPVSRQQVEAALQTYRSNLTRGADVVADGRQLYDWLLRPALQPEVITPEQIKTLIFVLDGPLRLIPMATLHDGSRFLVRTYATSLVLGLDVRDPEVLPPRPQTPVLAASLEVPPAAEQRFYSNLPGVTVELQRIQATDLPVTTLQDEAFTSAALNQQLLSKDYRIVHLATHGQFGSSRETTYILAADGRISIDQLGQIFRSRRLADTRLEMLILSACKTATGDSREVLGIAGATVQSGARSTIATLWSVDDGASVLFTETLYGQLARPGVSRAEALRQAQVALLDRYPGRPRYWAPYVLVGSWR